MLFPVRNAALGGANTASKMWLMSLQSCVNIDVFLRHVIIAIILSYILLLCLLIDIARKIEIERDHESSRETTILKDKCHRTFHMTLQLIVFCVRYIGQCFPFPKIWHTEEWQYPFQHTDGNKIVCPLRYRHN